MDEKKLKKWIENKRARSNMKKILDPDILRKTIQQF
jgi:hypothetical protein